MLIPLSKPSFSKSEEKTILKVIKSGWLTHGEYNEKFEKYFKSYIGSKYCLSLNSCTAAMHLSLITLGIKAGDEVITTPYTFYATIGAIVTAGAKPVFVDVKEDFNISS